MWVEIDGSLIPSASSNNLSYFGFLGLSKATSNVSSPIAHALDSNIATEWKSPGVSRDSTNQELNITVSFGQVSQEKRERPYWKTGEAILNDRTRHSVCVFRCYCLCIFFAMVTFQIQ